MSDKSRYPSSGKRNRHGQRSAEDAYQRDEKRYSRQPYDRQAGSGSNSRDHGRGVNDARRRDDRWDVASSRRRSQDGDYEARMRRARYREEDREYEEVLRARSVHDDDEYDSYYTPAAPSSRRNDWIPGYRNWSSKIPSFDGPLSRYMGRVQSVFTRSMRATRRSNNQLLARFAKLQPWQRIAIIAVLIIAVLGSSLLSILSGYQQYTQIKVRGDDGVQKLLAIKDLLSTTDKGLSIEDKAKATLQPAVLAEIKQDSDAALNDFEQIDAIMEQHLSVIGLAGLVPGINSKVAAVGHLAKVGIDVARLGEDFASHGAALAPMFATPLFSPTGPAIISPATFQVLQQVLTDIQANGNDMLSQLAMVQPSDLPVNAQQRGELLQVTTKLPGIMQTINALMPNLPMLRWALGVDSPRLFLVQTMDRAELRPGGGFTGQFGQLSLHGARLGTISLTDVTVLDNYDLGHHAPAQYQSWWPFGSWALRESNMSGDFPTSAQLAIKAYTTESGRRVDGDISFSVEVIAHLLAPDIVGPIAMPCYKVTITDQNLENEIHYFQLGAGGALDRECTTASSSTTTLRKSFTAALALQLQDRIRSLPADRLGKLLQSISADFTAKNIEIYFGNSAAEAELTKAGLAAAMLRDNSVDSTYIVQSNISANKGSTFVTTKVDEKITLTAGGGAEHDLTVTMYYHPTGDIYSGGLDTMRDYVRVYVPSQSRFVTGSGFDETTTNPLCYSICTPKEAPVCQATSDNPRGAFLPGAYAPSFPRTEGSGTESGYGYTHTDNIGGPNNFQSDEPGRGMYGGLIVIPPFCTATWTLQWTVPHIAGTTGKQNLPYAFTEQHQSGTDNNLTVTISPASGVAAPVVKAHTDDQESDLTWKLARS